MAQVSNNTSILREILNRLDNLEKRMDTLEKRLDSLESKVIEIQRNQPNLNKGYFRGRNCPRNTRYAK